ncbi:MAG: flavin reductase family protein [Alicyclobacillaceae bacterium]|nr:flavin reductase family protein [Alicyclobacillaceae bacterium]
MEIEIQSMEKRDRYLLMTNIVVPRPIAWVTTMGADGTLNAAPFSFFNVMSTTPPVLGLCVDGWKDTVRHITETREYVINIVPEEMAEAMNITAIEFPPGESELPHAGLTACPSRKIRVPGISQSPIHIECRYRDMIKLAADGAESHWVMGDVVHVHIDDAIWEDGRIRYDRLKPLGRLGGSWYTRVGEETLLRMKRIPYSDWKEGKVSTRPSG